MASHRILTWDGLGRCPDGGLYERVESWYVCLLCNRRGADWAHCTSIPHVNRLIAHLRLAEEMQDELAQPPLPPQQQQLQLVWVQPGLGAATVVPPPPPPAPPAETPPVLPPPPPVDPPVDAPQVDLLTVIQNLTNRVEALEERVAALTAALEVAAWTTSGWVNYS